MLAFCGLPLFFFELNFGQFASLGPLAIWTVSPIFKGIGIGMVAVSAFVGLYYNILVAYILYFFFASMSPELPWKECTNHWNTENCITLTQMGNKTWLSDYLNGHCSIAISFRSREVLQLSSGIDELGPIVWQLALCLLIAWVTVFLVLLKGIASLGKVVYFTSTFPYVMMTILVINNCLLDGATDGLVYYLKPDFNKLTNAEVWSDAAVQIFYSLSTCSGGLIAMASYNKFNHNTLRDSLMVPIINCLTSVYAGLAIFAVLGYMAKQKGVPIEDVAESGPGLVFVVYPEGLTNMPVSTLWALLFFFMMLVLGFSSEFSIVECIFTAIMDEFPHVFRSSPIRPIMLRFCGCIFFFIISLPMVTQGGFYLFSLCDSYAGGFPRLFTGIFELVAVCWVYGITRFSEDVALMIGHRPHWYFKLCWCILTPGIVVGIVAFKAVAHESFSLFNGSYVFPDWANLMGWGMVFAVVIWIPVWAIIHWCRHGGAEAMKKSAAPLSTWGPAMSANKTGHYAKAAEMDIASIEQSEFPDTIILNGIENKGFENTVYIENIKL
ncbi:hypothetical protein CAPTEDRAFT_156299 [Capitella teleta]|uniref:Transporter n=1 Tax=Capitella teleta TaxID=283909 RepID=R7UTL5_CAPTE|nr:hypothetical protein CAPTEDRAFT_156299 [Capitella teleta]|eukprot:ELU09520.1 hypothetical protein CAPTEDRAFT_156299 [Capitella teleta]